MRILVLDTVYRQAKNNYSKMPRSVSWDDDLNLQTNVPIGKGQALSSAFRDCGMSSVTLTLNIPEKVVAPIQHKIVDRGEAIARLPFLDSYLFRLSGITNWIGDEVDRLGPDIVYCMNINLLPPEAAARIRERGILLVGQISSPLPPKKYWSKYNHIFSAMPSIIKRLEENGISASHLGLWFDPAYCEFAKKWEEREISSIFVGSLGRHHKNSFSLLRAAADADPNLRIYSPAMPAELDKWGLKDNYYDKAFGKDMYRLLGNSKLVINRHAGFARGLSANLRMYEATGMGAALLTEKTNNLPQIFFEDEVYSYENLSDVSRIVAKLMTDEDEIRTVASRGSLRSHENHTVTHRAREIARELEKLIGGVS